MVTIAGDTLVYLTLSPVVAVPLSVFAFSIVAAYTPAPVLAGDFT